MKPGAPLRIAALVAANYSIQEDGLTPCTGSTTETCYGDWYLPSKEELNYLYQERNVVGGFADNSYWSSTEDGSNGAWVQFFGNGFQFDSFKLNPLAVRAVRAF